MREVAPCGAYLRCPEPEFLKSELCNWEWGSGTGCGEAVGLIGHSMHVAKTMSSPESVGCRSVKVSVPHRLIVL